MKIIFGLIILGVVVVLNLVAFWVSRPIFDEVIENVPTIATTIALQKDALTFFRTISGETFLATEFSDNKVMGIALSQALDRPITDALDAINLFGYAALSTLDKDAAISINLEQLGLPFVPSYPHIAAGTNYKAHAEEVGLEDGPFLFPKLSRATPWNGGVPRRARLDYEVEICVVPLTTYTLEQPSSFGYVLCSDYTDRWRLIRDINLDRPLGQTGFPDAKGGDGMLSIGPFLVVPRQDREFYKKLELGLALNGELRQRSSAGLMIWSPDEIIVNAISDCEVNFTRQDGSVSLTACGEVAAGTLILTGTPSGVLFNLASIWSSRAYLQSGDNVMTYATHLGMLHNKVVDP
jgi:2-keto-4-pentenoate hydratase/2-oxohepta-3-ene-1,7-dioic acid hydratase in catechol pathway